MDRQIIVDICLPVASKGGFEYVLNLSAKYLAEKGYHVRVFQMLWSGTTWLDPAIEFHCLGKENEQTDWDTIGDRYVDYLEQEGNPDCIIASGWPLLVLILKKATLKRMLQCPLIGWPYGTSDYYTNYGAGGMDFFRYADYTFAISPCMEDELHKYAPQTHILPISNPVEVRKEDYCEDRDTKELAFVGRIAPEKNIPYILRCLAETNYPWKMTIVGDGDLRGVKRIADDLGIPERIQMLGWQDDPWKHLRHASAFVQASYYEGFGLAVVEALRSGMPVLSTPVGIAKTIIQIGKNGYLFSTEGEPSLTQILNMLGDKSLDFPRSEECRDSASSFTPQNALSKIESCLQKVLNDR